MNQKVCISCRKPGATLACQADNESVCKDCVQFVEESTFSFLQKVPEELSHRYYCSPCYDSKVVPALESYSGTMENARNVYVFFIAQRKAIPIIRRSKETVRVDVCADRDETVLRLAFQAAEMGYNAIIETELVSEKVRNHAYQTSRWQGKAVPAQVDPVKVERHDEIRKR